MAAQVNQSGFQVPVKWPAEAALPERARLRLVFEGKRRQDIKLSAIYVR